MNNEKPQFKVGFDMECEYSYQGKTYRVRFGAHRINSSADYFPTIVKCIGTVMHRSDLEFHEFPSPEVVKVFSEQFGLSLVGAKWSKDFDVVYQEERGELVDLEHSVYLKEWRTLRTQMLQATW